MANNNWRTPQWVLDPIVEFYNGVDLDPFASEGSSLVQAKQYYTEKIDGYKMPWGGNVFANPPYGKPHLGQATTKADYEYYGYNSRWIQILMLIPAYTSTDYFQKYVLKKAPGILFYNKRISFLDENLQPGGSPTFHSVLIYWGSNTFDFKKKFEKYGEVFLR